MQQRNFVLFMVLSFLILVGWVWLQNKLWPPPPPRHKVDWTKVAPAVNLVANRGPLGGLLVDLGRTQNFPPPAPPRPAPRWADFTDKERKIVRDSKFMVLLPPPLPTTFALLGQLLPPELAKSAEVAKEIPFGGKDFYIQGSFTTRGAGIQKLYLNKFKAANWLGQPTEEAMELIGDDPEVASFLMYHYPAEKEKDKWDNPVPSLGRQLWKAEPPAVLDNGVQEFRFTTTVPEEAFKHLQITKIYRLGPRDYHLTMLLEIQDTRAAGAGVKAVPFQYQVAGAHGLPLEGSWYTSTYRDSLIGMVDSRGSLWRTKEEAMRVSIKKGGEAVPDRNAGPGDSYLQYAGVVNQYFGSVIVVDDKQPPEEGGGGDMKKILRWARPTLESVEVAGKLSDFDDKFAQVGDVNGRIMTMRSYLLLPRVRQHLADTKMKKDANVVVSYYETEHGRIATWIRPGETPRSGLDDLTVRVNSEVLELKPGQKIAHQFLLYHGPVKTKLLSQFGGNEAVDPDLVDRYTYRLHLKTLTDYRWDNFMGKFSQAIHFTDLLIAVTGLMHWLLYYLHLVIGSYGLSIILLTVLVRGIMFPISKKQAYFSIKMQEIAPEMKKIKEKYPNDRRAQTEATMELYRKHGVSPLGSCLPLFMQMPIFLGLYYALQESIHFRLAGFLWIRNLAAPDMLLWWTENIPWISDPDNLGGFFYLGPYLNLLPLFAVGFMVVQQKLMTPPPVDEQQEMQQKMMKYMMVFMGILFYKVASGLCIYFIASSLWGLAERKFLPKKKSALQLALGGGLPTGKGPTSTKPGPQPPAKGKGLRKGPGKKEEKPNGALDKIKDWWADVLKQAKKK